MKSFNEFVRDMENTILEYGQQTEDLYKRFAKALDQNRHGGVASGKPPSDSSFQSDFIEKVGFNAQELRKAGVIEKSPVGGYQLNKDLIGSGGKLGKTPPLLLPQRKNNPYSKIQTMKSPAAAPPPPRRS